MKPKEYRQPRVPINYVMITLSQAKDLGLNTSDLLDGLGLEEGILEKPDARIPLLTYGQIVARTLRLSGDNSLGYDFGLRTTLTSHGLLGFGLMSQNTIADMMSLAEKYMPHLRTPGFTCRFLVEDDDAVVEVREAVPYGPLRQYAYDMLLVSLYRTLNQIAPGLDIKLWFDTPRPDYYEHYRDRLPEVRFGMGTNQIRIPVAQIHTPLSSANPSTAELVLRQCEEELARIGATDDILARVRAMLINANFGYLGLEEMSGMLHMSSRTLKRKLKEHDQTYQQLLDEARQRDSIRLLEDTHLPLEEIAHRVGYSETSNFCRAFQRWTGHTPSSYRHGSIPSD